MDWLTEFCMTLGTSCILFVYIFFSLPLYPIFLLSFFLFLVSFLFQGGWVSIPLSHPRGMRKFRGRYILPISIMGKYALEPVHGVWENLEVGICPPPNTPMGKYGSIPIEKERAVWGFIEGSVSVWLPVKEVFFRVSLDFPVPWSICPFVSRSFRTQLDRRGELALLFYPYLQLFVRAANRCCLRCNQPKMLESVD